MSSLILPWQLFLLEIWSQVLWRHKPISSLGRNMTPLVPVFGWNRAGVVAIVYKLGILWGYSFLVLWLEKSKDFLSVSQKKENYLIKVKQWYRAESRYNLSPRYFDFSFLYSLPKYTFLTLLYCLLYNFIFCYSFSFLPQKQCNQTTTSGHFLPIVILKTSPKKL